MVEITLSLHKKQLTNLFKYRAFGVNISSEIELPELANQNFDISDVHIQFGENPDELENIRGRGVLFQSTNDDFLFRFDSIGSIRVQNGKTITVSKRPGATMEELRLFLLGSAFGALLHQVELLPIHGSCVLKNNSAQIFAGPSGAGKSSLAATLVKKGYQFIADDISVINMNKDIPSVYPGIPQFKLWEDVLKKLETDIDAYTRVRPQLQKYKKPVNINNINSCYPVSSVTIINIKNSPGFEIQELKGSAKFNALKNNTFRYQFIPGLGKTDKHFHLITKLANSCRVYQLDRPAVPLLLEEMVDYIGQNIPH